MALPEFDYVLAEDLKSASFLAKEKGDKAMIMAGGTDVILIVKAKGPGGVETVIDIKNIPGLDQLDFEEGKGLKIGALTKLFDIQTSETVKDKMPAVADAAHYVASAQIRRKGTMAGNICNASPSADTAPILTAMDAKVNVYSVDGERQIPVSDFFKGVKKTALENGEIVTSIEIPQLGSQEGSAYFKHSVRKAMDLAIIGVAAWIKMDGRKVADCRIALGGVGVTPLRAPEAEKLLIGNELTEELLEKAGVAASEGCTPISDVRASAEYRKDMVRVYTKRAVRKAVETLKA
ncbi:MAG: xanthine dehydrogenase family protein subunit M [Firmicutes bacterium]|nr:xanthine dehydrogenase family protein subunit M [Bacillota bacterium]